MTVGMRCEACGHRFPRDGALVLRKGNDPPVIRCPNCKDGPVVFDIPTPDTSFKIRLK